MMGVIVLYLIAISQTNACYSGEAVSLKLMDFTVGEYSIMNFSTDRE